MILTNNSVHSRTCTGDFVCLLHPTFLSLSGSCGRSRPKFLQSSAAVPASCDAGHFETLTPLCEEL